MIVAIGETGNQQAALLARQLPAQAAGGTDRVIRSLAGVTVAGLAGAISYSHMRVLAEANGAGRAARPRLPPVGGRGRDRGLAGPAGRPAHWPPVRLAALAIGTAASLAAKVAAAGPAPISRVIAGWPAIALLIAVKLLSGMLEHRDGTVPPPSPEPSWPSPLA